MIGQGVGELMFSSLALWFIQSLAILEKIWQASVGVKLRIMDGQRCEGVKLKEQNLKPFFCNVTLSSAHLNKLVQDWLITSIARDWRHSMPYTITIHSSYQLFRVHSTTPGQGSCWRARILRQRHKEYPQTFKTIFSKAFTSQPHPFHHLCRSIPAP